MANIFRNLKKDSKPSRNAFDLSHYDIFSQKVGTLRPVFQLEVVPGDHIEIKPSNFLRTMQPLQTDAFLKASQNLDFYFVPFQQLWSSFPEFYAQVKDPQTALQNGTMPDSVPFFNIARVLFRAHSLWKKPRVFGYPYDDWSVEPMSDTFKHTFYSWFFGLIDLLDVLGYGNYLPVLSAMVPGDSKDITNETSLWTFLNLWDTEEDFNTGFMSVTESGNTFNVSAFRVMAYQRIWYNYYRNHYFDVEVDDYLPSINFDSFDSTTGEITDTLTDSEFLQFFSVRYRPWKKDLFTGLMPSSQFGDVAVANINSNTGFLVSPGAPASAATVYADVPASSASLDNASVYTASTGNVRRLSVNTSSVGVSVLAIRTAEALQRWKETVLRNGSKTINQFEGHFGVQPRYVRDWYPDFLGSVDGELSLSTVTASSAASSQVENGRVGDVAANIVSNLSTKTIKFDAQDFGVIIGVYSLLPDAQYNSYMLDEHNVHLAPTDFLMPEFENVGLAPVYRRSLDALTGNYGASANEVVGYAPRYIEYKQAVSKIHGLFYYNTLMRKVDEQQSSEVVTVYKYVPYSGSFANWAIPRHSQLWTAGLDNLLQDINRLYVHPNVVDSVFYDADDGTPQSDQLVVAFNFDVKAVRPISVIGLPQY